MPGREVAVKRTIAVLGLSVFGREVALGLADSKDIDVVAFDYRREEVEAVSSRVRQAAMLDVRQTEMLEEFAASSWAAAVIGIRRHFDATVLVTHYLKAKAGVPKVVVQVNNLQEEEAIRVIGADVTVFPERDSARHMVAALANPHLTDIFELGGDAEIVEVEVPPSFVGHSLKDLALRKRFQLQVAALRRRKDDAGATRLVTEIPPDPDRALRRDERMLIIGEHRHLAAFIEKLPNL